MKKKKNRITGILSLLVLLGIIASLLVYGWKAGAVRQAAEEDSEEDEGDTASDLEEPYVLAYLELLKEYAGDDNDVENERARFALAFIDDDEVPELLLMEDDCHAGGVKVFAYVQNRVVELGEFGSFGKMQYVENRGMIFGHFMGQGESNNDFFRIEEGKADLICSMHSWPDHSGEAFADLYEVDGCSVDEEAYRAKWQELYEDQEYVLIGYEDGIPIRGTELKSVLPEAIDDLVLKRATACFTYEELPDGTLRITGYDEEKNTQNPYQVMIPSMIGGKQVSTLGKECLGMPYAGNLLELTVPDGITTIEENVIENAYDISLIKLPDSVTSIDEKAFWRNEGPWPVVIACNDTAYAYQYAKENGYACQVMEAALPENDFLGGYRKGATTGIPYFAHIRTEGEKFDFITIEYRDNEVEKRLEGEFIYHEPNEFVVLVLDKVQGNILQCIDSSCLDAEKVAFCWLHGVFCQNFLSFADWNFDGEDDIRCYQGVFGTGAASYSSLFVYEPDGGFYKNVPEFLGIDSPSLRRDKQCIYGFSRGGAAAHYADRYEYIDGRLTYVARLSRIVNTGNEVEIVDERLLDGEWRIYRQETFYPRDPSAEEPWRDAYEQSECLYVEDGYWDLY